jgi:hypothetical protein
MSSSEMGGLGIWKSGLFHRPLFPGKGNRKAAALIFILMRHCLSGNKSDGHVKVRKTGFDTLTL